MRPRRLVPHATAGSQSWSRAYSYDDAGNIITIGAQEFVYDALGRLTEMATSGTPTEQYGYDRYGNQTSRMSGGVTQPIDTSADSFGARHRPIEERLKQLGDEIPRLQGEIDFLKINYLSSSEVVSEAQNLYSRWPSLPFEEKRRVIENITDKIVVGDGDISLELCYLPSSAERLSKEHRNLTPAVPFCHLTFSASRPVERRYERVKVAEGTLGAALRARRWERRLDQHQAAEEIGVSVATYCGWENNGRKPDLRNVPGAIRFLGRDFRPSGTSLRDRIRHERTAAGLSMSELAKHLGVNESTLRGWEAGLRAPSHRAAARLADWLNRSGPEPKES